MDLTLTEHKHHHILPTITQHTVQTSRYAPYTTWRKEANKLGANLSDHPEPLPVRLQHPDQHETLRRLSYDAGNLVYEAATRQQGAHNHSTPIHATSISNLCHYFAEGIYSHLRIHHGMDASVQNTGPPATGI